MSNISTVKHNLSKSLNNLIKGSLKLSHYIKIKKLAIKQGSDNTIVGIYKKNKSIEWSIFNKTKQGYRNISTSSMPLLYNNNISLLDTLKNCLSEIFANFDGIISFALPATDVLTQIVDLPTQIPEEIAGMIQLQIDKISPYDIDDTVFSYEILCKFEKFTRIIIAITHKNRILELKEISESLHLDIQRIDIDVMGLWHNLEKVNSMPAQGRYFIFFLENDEGILLGIDNKKLIASKGLLCSLSMEIQEYVNDLLTEFTNMLMKIELEHGFNEIAGIEFLFSNLQDNIALSIHNAFKEQYPQLPIKLTQINNQISYGIAERFIEFLKEHPLKQNRKNNITFAPSIDFVPISWRKALEETRFKIKLFKASLLIVSLWFILILTSLILYKISENKVHQLNEELKILNTPVTEVRAMQQRIKEFERYIYRSNNVLDYLLEIVSLMPQDVVLNSFQYTKANNINIRGESPTANPILDFKQALDKSKMFSSIDMGNIMPTKRKDITVQTFQITIHLKEEMVDIKKQQKPQQTGIIKISSSEESIKDSK